MEGLETNMIEFPGAALDSVQCGQCLMQMLGKLCGRGGGWGPG